MRGKVMKSSRGQVTAYIETKNQVFPRMEDKLARMDEGQETTLQLNAKEAYGDYRENLVLEIAKEKFQSELKLDQWVQVKSPSGRLTKLQVVDFTDDSVILDGNHPLAGMDLYMEVKLLERRPADERELKSGEVDGLSISPEDRILIH